MLFFISTFFAGSIYAQAIVETFEESSWTSASLVLTTSAISTGGGASVTNSNFGTTTVAVTASSASIPITTYRNFYMGLFTCIYSWYSTGFSAEVHSGNTSVYLSAGEGVLIAPVANGVVPATFWMANTGEQYIICRFQIQQLFLYILPLMVVVMLLPVVLLHNFPWILLFLLLMRRIGLLCISLPFGRIVNSIGLGQVMLTQPIVHAAASKVELR